MTILYTHAYFRVLLPKGVIGGALFFQFRFTPQEHLLFLCVNDHGETLISRKYDRNHFREIRLGEMSIPH